MAKVLSAYSYIFSTCVSGVIDRLSCGCTHDERKIYKIFRVSCLFCSSFSLPFSFTRICAMPMICYIIIIGKHSIYVIHLFQPVRGRKNVSLSSRVQNCDPRQRVCWGRIHKKLTINEKYKVKRKTLFLLKDMSLFVSILVS